METYIAILRGINVSGHKMIKMEELKARLTELNLTNLTTYIQSGNLVFEYESSSQSEIAQLIRHKIKKDFGFEVEVIVRNVKELIHVFENNSFIASRKEDIDYLHVTFLSGKPADELLQKIASLKFASDEFIVSGDVVYVFCPNGYGITKINNTFFEKKLNLTATTRNWKTVRQLVEMAIHR